LARGYTVALPPADLEGWRLAYWRRPFVRSACAAMAEKYAALAVLEGLPAGAEQDAALRAAALRWPGCLRESQLAGPARRAERGLWAAAGAAGPERARAEWLADGQEAVVLWSDLHLLLGDVRRWRSRGGRGEQLEAFVGWLRGDEESGARWPDAALLAATGGSRVRVRQAYGWLAAQVGLGLAELNWRLFARAGPWDRRPGDPAGSA
jgi:hypothetical protein